jgi:uncharacterized membrane protein (UPF0127 family)
VKRRFAAPFVAAIGLLWLTIAPAQATKQAYCLPTHIQRAKKDIARLNLEVASTPEKRATGLMYREHMAACDGMAFFFPPIGTEIPKAFAVQKFWMKNTLIPLDILFIDAKNRITDIAHGVPKSLTPIGPDIPSATVIEIDAGRAAKEGIKVGDMVHYELATHPYMLAD